MWEAAAVLLVGGRRREIFTARIWCGRSADKRPGLWMFRRSVAGSQKRGRQDRLRRRATFAGMGTTRLAGPPDRSIGQAYGAGQNQILSRSKCRNLLILNDPFRISNAHCSRRRKNLRVRYCTYRARKCGRVRRKRRIAKIARWVDRAPCLPFEAPCMRKRE